MNTQAEKKYFDSILYTRAYINEVKLIEPKKGSKYCAVNASILDEDSDGKKIYRTIDLIVSGQKAKEILWKLREKWPADRMARKSAPWIADINIGSLRAEAYPKKDGTVGAVLKGRLLNIRALKVGDEQVLGEISEELPLPMLVAPGYVNEIDPEKGLVKFAMLDGPVDEPEYRNINLTLGEIDAINELIARDLCPKGFEHRATNPKIFAILEVSRVICEGFKGKEGPAAALKGELSRVRYLKVNDEVIVGGKGKAA